MSSHFDFNNIHQMYTRNRDKRGGESSNFTPESSEITDYGGREGHQKQNLPAVPRIALKSKPLGLWIKQN